MGSILMPARGADLDRCGAILAEVETTSNQVLGICGQPSYRDRWLPEAPGDSKYADDGEIWYYNFGPGQLIRVFEFHGGRLTSADTDGYGFSPVRDPHCSPAQIVEGMSKFRLLSFCGEPFSRHANTALSQMMEQNRIFRGYYREEPRSDYVRPVYREEWIYNFGARSPTRTAILENGWVTHVGNGDRGFDVH